MADTKISAMTPLAAVPNAVELPVVSVLVNFKCTKAAFLTGNAAENIRIVSSVGQWAGLENSFGTSFVHVDEVGTVGLIGTAIAFQSGMLAVCAMGMTGLGSWFVNVGLGQNAYMGDAGLTCFVKVDLALGTVQILAPAGANVSYAPGAPGTWFFPPPVTMQAALDRCAALLQVLNAGVGP